MVLTFVYMCHIYFGFPYMIINNCPNYNIILHLYLFGISSSTNFNATIFIPLALFFSSIMF